jgi:hypothetical protein
MKVSAQVYDFIFAARLDEMDDGVLIEATREAGNVYFGLAFELWQEDQLLKRKEKPQDAIPYLDRTKWRVSVTGDPQAFYVGTNPLATFSELAFASRGLGSLSIKFDRDGVLRRVPLVVRYEGDFYPILPFLVICDYLKVAPENIVRIVCGYCMCRFSLRESNFSYRAPSAYGCVRCDRHRCLSLHP